VRKNNGSIKNMNSNQNNLLELREIVYRSLDPIILKDYCLLDVPNHFNIGDHLICEGEFAYLRRLPFKRQYMASLTYCDFKRIPPDGLILLHGGGNFGDLWRWQQNFKIRVIDTFPKSKIIFFPQTVYYKDSNLLRKDAEIFNQHPDLTICARDTKSFEILKEHFTNSTILLVPDMAFCLDLEKYNNNTETDKILILKRQDRELNQSFDEKALKDRIHTHKKIEVSDWPSMEPNIGTKMRGAVSRVENIISNVLVKKPGFKNIINHSYGFKRRDLSKWYMLQGINFINNYDEIYTTRLHGYILSMLLDKKVNLIDNSYGKNSTFYNTWMKEFENSCLIN
jgi:exopolysaccharide biosynthesis predicted pyruvyltransferase EpsI